MKTQRNSIGRDLDQFYTNPLLAQRLFNDLIADHLGDRWSGDVRWLEPSCGTGAFLSLLPEGAIGVDLEPKCPGAVQADFLNWTLPAIDHADDRPLVVVGNPPFKHDVAFFNRCAELGAERIAFIVPRSWQKPTVQNKLHRAFHLVHEEVLPLDAFIFEGKPAKVPTVFQVWERSDAQRSLTVLPATHADFAFVPDKQRHTADFAIQRIGANAGRVKDKDVERLNTNSHRFVRVADRTKVAEVRALFDAVDWAPIKACVAGSPSISNPEMVQAYETAVVDRLFATTDWFADIAGAGDHPAGDAPETVTTEPALPVPAVAVAPMTIQAVYERIAELQEASGLDADGRTTGGVVYTPVGVARTLVDLARLQPHETVLEPACGRGMLVFAMVQSWLERGLTHEQVARWGEQCLFAGDLDGLAVEQCAGLWRGFFAAHGVVSDLSPNLRVGDALFEGWSDRTFDVTLTNPPYVSLRHLPADYAQRVRTTFATCAKGHADLYRAFLERAQTQSGRCVMIVPNAWMRTVAGGPLRALLRPRVRAVIDFESRRVFLGRMGASVLTAIIATGPATQAPVLFRTTMPHESDAPWTVAFRQSDAALGPKAWALAPAVPEDEVDPDGLTLADIAEIHIGVATNCNEAFELPKGTVDGQDFLTQDPVRGCEVRLPLPQAPRFLKLTTIKTLDDIQTSGRILCPYGEAFKVLPEDELARSPDLHAWFEARAAQLRARDKGVPKGYAWYEFGRAQGLVAFQPTDELFLVPCMAKGPMRPVQITPASMGERFLWASGYVVKAKDPKDHARVQAVLESPETWRFLQRRGKVWTGDHRSFTPNLLGEIPVPETVVAVAAVVPAAPAAVIEV